MKTIRLVSIKMKNFKMVKSGELSPNGNNVEIYAKNESGKSTRYDAWLWLLFGKNSLNQTKFDIKELDENGNVKRHNIEHEVSGVVAVDGQEYALKRVLKEKWTTPRNQATKILSGHTTDYWIDGVPGITEGQYKNFITETILDEDTFRLLSDVRYFNSVLKWEKRREILLTSFPDTIVTDTEVLEANRDLKKLPEVLCGKNIDDFRKIARARQNKIKEEQGGINTRIDEVFYDLPDVSDLSKDGLEKTDYRLKIEIDEKRKEKARVENGGQVAELKKKLRHAEAEHIDRQNGVQKKANEQVQDLQKKVSGLTQQSDDLNNQIIGFDKQIKLNDASLIQKNADREKLLDQYRAIKSRQMECPETETVCPTCGQDLPEHQVTAALDKLTADFNVKKAADLTMNKKNGLACAAEIQTLKNDNDAFLKQIVGLTADKGKIEGQIATLKASIAKLETLRPESVDTTPEIVELKAEIEKLKSGSASKLKEIETDIQKLEASRDSNAELLTDIKTCSNAKKRITELEAEEKKLAAEYEKLESGLYLVSQFARTQANIMEGRIRDKFQITRFKMFNIQVNGETDDRMCEAMVNGAPYSTAMNNGNQIKCGVDIINTLSTAYNVSVPLWIDNAESVTDMPNINTQTIKMFVSQKNKKLKVVIDEPKEAAQAA